MAENVISPGMPAPGPSRSFLSSLFAGIDPNALKFGVKFGVAGISAVYISLLIRLSEPTWALFTVFVLMIAQYVGAIAEKSLFRFVGTIVGGLLGYLLTGSLEQQPWVFLPLVSLIIGFCTAMYGQNRYPYAFLLCGMTMVVVVSNGITQPDNSWKYMLWRIEEVSVGIIITLVVQSLFWPRFARREFTKNMHLAFADLEDCFRSASRLFLEGGEKNAITRAESFPVRITALRTLLDLAGRESHFFHQRLPTYYNITTCLARISSAIATMDDSLPESSLYRTALAGPFRQIHKAIAEGLHNLSCDNVSPEGRRTHREAVDKATDDIARTLAAMRDDERIFTVPLKDARIVGVHSLALADIAEQIREAHKSIDSLPQDPLEYSREIELATVSRVPSPFWIHAGIKSAIAVFIALILENWLNPPGGTMMVLGAWVFTALNACSPGGQGDQRAFHFTVYNAFVMAAFCIVVLFARPMLSSYAVMNTVMFTWLFLWGFLSFNTRGVTIPMQLAMLLLVGVLGLNGQEPISFQAVVDLYFGIVLAQLLAAIVQRMFWPSLPQLELRNRFVEFLALAQNCVSKGFLNLPFWQRSRLGLLPGESAQRIDVLRPPFCPPDEPPRLYDYLHALQRVTNELASTVGCLAPLLPPEHKVRGEELIAKLEGAIHDLLAAHQHMIASASGRAPDATVLAGLSTVWRDWSREIRLWCITNRHPMLDSIRISGFTGRYVKITRDLLQMTESASTLRLPLYMGDYRL